MIRGHENIIDYILGAYRIFNNNIDNVFALLSLIHYLFIGSIVLTIYLVKIYTDLSLLCVYGRA